jgi:transcriptional regulator of arginine metabolism
VTLSRDVRELGLAKTPEGYKQIAPSEAGPNLATLAAEFLLDVRLAQNLVVLKTSPGHANSVAVAMDDEEWPEVVGTLAGDDTILVTAPDNATAETVRLIFGVSGRTQVEAGQASPSLCAYTPRNPSFLR